jgi:hypothetical protein
MNAVFQKEKTHEIWRCKEMDWRITREQYVRGLTACSLGIFLIALVWLSGCGRLVDDRRQEDNPEFTVVPVSNSSVMALKADDIRRIMEISGFTYSQIEQLGNDLYDALRQLGAAKIRMDRKHVEVTYAIRDDQVWIATRSRGLFVYDVRSGKFVLGPGTETDYLGALQSR